MNKIIFVSGGARSGKSHFAEKQALDIVLESESIGYIATAIVTDEDMAERIRHHQISRPKNFITFEQYRGFETFFDSAAAKEPNIFVFDCVTVAITNILFDMKEQELPIDFETCSIEVMNKMEQSVMVEFKKLIDEMRLNSKTLILVTNEVGLGLVASYRLGNIFRDISGRVNQYLAKEADEAYFMVSGLPLKLKG